MLRKVTKFFPLLVFMVLLFTGCGKEDETGGIVFEKADREGYRAVIYDGREYVPYTAISVSDRGEYLGYIAGDPDDKIYEYKGYSTDQWLISFLDSGLMDGAMLLKEENVTDIPEGLTSEYEWNQREE